MRRYLASSLVKGIGPVLAGRLVDCFGDDTLRVIDEQPERLTEAQGVGPRRVESIKRAWEEQQEIRSVMLFLQGHGVSAAYATRIYKTYGQDAVRVVQENPYRNRPATAGCQAARESPTAAVQTVTGLVGRSFETLRQTRPIPT